MFYFDLQSGAMPDAWLSLKYYNFAVYSGQQNVPLL